MVFRAPRESCRLAIADRAIMGRARAEYACRFHRHGEAHLPEGEAPDKRARNTKGGTDPGLTYGTWVGSSDRVAEDGAERAPEPGRAAVAAGESGCVVPR